MHAANKKYLSENIRTSVIGAYKGLRRERGCESYEPVN